ncbi:3-hydroxybutyryl-CoA dehydrogenase [Chitinophaga skermanii]|uniref:3-hydroxybutyryl-CoA dehydrogenase n=1 Tax=Chitinophaga skermanii TaxID=331697 RepID=A0A327QCG8_9BACT|nr:3-hydroxyacyl-CoA dehydrogenase NAD-binding domain-containing protein [Chitinophaga skermanii]RAJ01558.1 3-hydroxybutyryl-CoA dehydrogenase [Chitinophaga skermanii]
MIEHISTIVVCGAGTMGAGIAQTAVLSGFRTILFDLNEAVLEKAYQNITLQFEKLYEKGKLSTAARELAYLSLETTTDLQTCFGDVIIEAIVEKIPAKVGLFNQLAEINHSDVIFCSNTSSLSISAIADKVQNPSRVVGMHFFNPAPVMKLVEIIRGTQTSEAVANRTYELAKQMGKTPVHVKDSPGFIVNRVARHYYLEAMQLAEDGVASLPVIDKLLENAGFKMGPFALMDLIGNDVNLAVTTSLYEAFDQAPRFKPGQLQIDKVAKGELGKKTGKGFYDYTNK